jgi:hypothetical protein
MRKIKVLTEEAKKQVEKLKETEELIKLARQEELDKLESITKQIQEICVKNDVFCGVIITIEDLLSIIRIAVESKEAVHVPFRIYIKEDKEE